MFIQDGASVEHMTKSANWREHFGKSALRNADDAINALTRSHTIRGATGGGIGGAITGAATAEDGDILMNAGRGALVGSLLGGAIRGGVGRYNARKDVGNSAMYIKGHLDDVAKEFPGAFPGGLKENSVSIGKIFAPLLRDSYDEGLNMTMDTIIESARGKAKIPSLTGFGIGAGVGAMNIGGSAKSEGAHPVYRK